jgi:hypothetical protein
MSGAAFKNLAEKSHQDAAGSSQDTMQQTFNVMAISYGESQWLKHRHNPEGHLI